jgi:glutamate racemase
MDAIGICDWGIGGLGFYRLLALERPDLDVVYIGDQGAVPYGRLPVPTLAARLTQVLETFSQLGVSRVVVACNAAGTVLGRIRTPPTCTSGVILPTLDALLQAPHVDTGIIGGRRTIRSGAYAVPLRRHGVLVVQRVAQPLSALIEAGRADMPETHALLRGLLAPLKDVDRLVLGCTHYIAVEPAIRTLLPRAEIVDPATLAWRAMRADLPARISRVGAHRFYTTGDPSAMREQALAAFGVHAEVSTLPALTGRLRENASSEAQS